ncbi:g1515 [Coccomyxa viridis]|uniref:G1515 protein n=1 Tax=Coccomyxa viridis TaxID=1274662 RepID=A0ABP1FI63_9CHLO
MESDKIEQTLYQCREVQLYRIPPRPSSGGHKSGDWKVDDRIFQGRLRVVSIGELCELRLEETGSGELFAMCPVPLGQREAAVEPASDSSRYFVLRLVDAQTKRHAFIGMGFADRSDAFDFNVALADHEKFCRRAKEVQVAKQDVRNEAPAAPCSEVASLYKKQDLSLKQGETLKINMKRPTNEKSSGSAGGFLSSLPGEQSSEDSPALISLAPPPPQGRSAAQHFSGVDSSASQSSKPPPAAESGDAEFFSLSGPSDSQAVASQMSNLKPFGTQQTKTTAKEHDSWATFE